MKKITSVDELKEAATAKNGEMKAFFVALESILRSSKEIRYHPQTKTFDVLSLVDGVFFEGLTEDELKRKTNILWAIENGNFYEE
ncbi:MAG TPA: hypothetical protein VI112_18175 [Bacteroidia bacterium]|jgi:hypothetical protein